jgi:hypothetical protein
VIKLQLGNEQFKCQESSFLWWGKGEQLPKKVDFSIKNVINEIRKGKYDELSEVQRVFLGKRRLKMKKTRKLLFVFSVLILVSLIASAQPAFS